MEKSLPDLLQDWAVLLGAVDLHSRQSFEIQPPLSFPGLFELLSEAFHCLVQSIFEEGNIKLLSLSFPLCPHSLLGVSGYSCLLMPIGALHASPISSRSHSQYCWHQPLIYHDLSNKKWKFCWLFHWALFTFLKLWKSDFQFCLYGMKKFTSFFQWKLWFSHSITAREKEHSKQLWDEVHDKWGGS